jgi:hypothetical protein
VIGAGSGNTPRFALFAQENAAITDLLRRFHTLLEPGLRAPLSPGNRGLCIENYRAAYAEAYNRCWASNGLQA